VQGEFIVDDQVKWTRFDEDIPYGSIGHVVASAGDRVQVQFSKGIFNLRATELVRIIQTKFGFTHHDQVKWSKSDDDIPVGSTGVVVGFTDERVRVRFPKDTYNFKPAELIKVSPKGLKTSSSSGRIQISSLNLPATPMAPTTSMSSRLHMPNSPLPQWSCIASASPVHSGRVSHRTHPFLQQPFVEVEDSESPSKSFDSAVTKLSNSLEKMQSSPSNAPAPQMPTRMTSAPRSSSLQEQGGLVINEHVAWTSPDVDLPKGITGIVVGFKDDLVQVKFIKDVYSIKETDLRRVQPRPPPAESRLLASPKSTYWQDAQKSTPKALHVPLTLAEESPSAPVEMKSGFASPKPHGNGTMQLKHEQFGFSISDQVVWTKSDADVPEGVVGVVIGFTSNRVQVMFPLGTFNFQPEELEKSRPAPHVHSLSISARPSDASVLAPPTAVEKFGFLLHEWVEWTKSDADVPKGSIGMIIGFTADRVQVRFPRHTFNLKPNELVKIPRHAGPSSSLQAINAAIAGSPRAIGYLSTP